MNVALINELVTPEEAWDHVFKDANAASHTDDELRALARIINGVSAAIQADVGPVRNRSSTEQYDGGSDRIFTRWKPIVTVTSIIDNGITLTEGTDFFVYKEIGALRRYGAIWGRPGLWGTSFPMSVTVTYTAGMSATVDAVPHDIKLAALLWVHEMWATGPANLSNVVTDQGVFIRPQAIPPQVNKYLQPYRSVGVWAV